MTPLSQRARVVGLFGWLAAAFVAAAIGSVASIHAGSFYAQLTRPEWAPPGWVFGPVWTALYTLMGIAAWLVWCVGGFRPARATLTVFLVQLAVNALWSWLFFGWQLGALSFADIVVLLALIIVNIMLFWRIRPLAGLLLAPYLVWVSFASLLNYTIWQSNPALLG